MNSGQVDPLAYRLSGRMMSKANRRRETKVSHRRSLVLKSRSLRSERSVLDYRSMHAAGIVTPSGISSAGCMR